MVHPLKLSTFSLKPYVEPPFPHLIIPRVENYRAWIHVGTGGHAGCCDCLFSAPFRSTWLIPSSAHLRPDSVPERWRTLLRAIAAARRRMPRQSPLGLT